MESIGADCQNLKKEYDSCFNAWFSEKFLKGNYNDACADIFKKYQACVKNAIKDKGINLEELEKPVLDTPLEKLPPAASGTSV